MRFMSQITDEVTVLDAGSPTPPEGPAACCKSGPILAVVQPEE
uniref:Geopeptide n=1 Tax=Geobacter metallireducens TaxID=28232 RepID=A0A831UA48_GEOME